MLTSLVSALLLLSVLLFLGPYFEALPVCVLGAIILVSLTGLLLKVMPTHNVQSLQYISKREYILQFFSFSLGTTFGFLLYFIVTPHWMCTHVRRLVRFSSSLLAQPKDPQGAQAGN